MFPPRVLRAALLATSVALIAATADACESSCSFRFCDNSKKYSLGHVSNKPFTAAICSGKTKVRVAQTGEALVNGSPISSFVPPGLSDRFPVDFIKAFSTPAGSAVGRQNAQGNQLVGLGGSCVSVPVTRILIGWGKNLRNLAVDECIAFRVDAAAPARFLRPAQPLPFNTGAPDVRPPPHGTTLRLGRVFAARRKWIGARVGTRHLRRELYILADASGSVGTILQPLRWQLKRILRTGPWTRSALGHYRDERDADRGFTPIRPLSSAHWKVARHFRRIRSARGGDHHEGGLHALHAVAERADIGWTPGSIRALLWLGDAPQHEPSCVKGRMVTRWTAVKALRKKGIRVIAVDLANRFKGLNSKPRAYMCMRREYDASPGQAKHIVRHTGGVLTEAWKKTVVRVVERHLKIFKVKLVADASHCQGMIAVHRFYVKGGLRVGEPEKKAVMQLYFKPSVCRKRWGFSCIIRFKAGESVVGEKTLEVSKVLGCPRLKNGKWF